jgi:uncharacterized protein (TIGR00251 family)
MDSLDVHIKDAALRFQVHVKPRSARSRVVGVRAGSLDVAVSAPPVEGRANAELVQVLSRHLGLPRRAITIVSGQGGRQKWVSVEGLSRDELLTRLTR